MIMCILCEDAFLWIVIVALDSIYKEHEAIRALYCSIMMICIDSILFHRERTDSSY